MRIRADLENAFVAFLTFGELSNVVTARFVRARLLDLVAALPVERLRYPSGQTVVHRGLEKCWPEVVVATLLALDRTAAVSAKRQHRLRSSYIAAT